MIKKVYLYLFFIILLISSIAVVAKFTKADSLEEALRKKEYRPLKDIAIVDITDNLEQESNDTQILLKEDITAPMHPLNIGVLKIQKTQRAIEKEVSEDIKKIFFLPKKIKVRSKIKGNKFQTYFIYRFEDK
ncbi:hypothetical protein [Nitrosophilus alvini]|uniref:hypothetical protein n=1 Tax=Nitrosophilus alvini TaxID=2714855 RepID=UPI00190D9302|nr:hypothetical protein [Nitrosophilus alvini]